MTTQYTPILKVALPVTGELSGTWGDVVNDNITSMFEQAIAGLATINTWTANAHTLTSADGTTSESRCAMLVAADGAGLSAAGEIICPAASKLYVLKNGSSYALTLKTSGGSGVAVAAGETAFLFCDGTHVNACVTTIINGRITGNLTVGGNATINGNTTLGNATSDTITATARFASGLIPSADNTYDLGSSGNSWSDVYIDGTAYLALVDISGGTIDGVSIGATTPATIANVDNLRLDGNTISSTNTNGNVVIAPNGTGDVQLDAGTVRVGDSGAGVTLTSNGAGALTVTTGGAANLTLSTNRGTNSGTITIANGANGNITLTPNGTGQVSIPSMTLSGGTANGVAYLNDSKVLTTGSGLAYNGTTLTVGTTSTNTNFRVENGSFNRVGALRLADAGFVFDSFDRDNTASQRTFIWQSGGSEQMRLTSTGLGLGTTNPTNKLSVNGNADISGNLGIGTSSPPTKLDIFGTGNIVRISTATEDATPNFFFRNANADALQFYISQDLSNQRIGNARGALIFDTGVLNIERMRLDSNGNLGLGVTPRAWDAGVKAVQVGQTGSLFGYSTGAGFGSNVYAGAGSNRYMSSGLIASVYEQDQGGHKWYTAPSGTAGNTISFTHAMTLDANGNLLVGTTNSGGTPSQGFNLLANSASSFSVGHASGSLSGSYYEIYAYNGGVIGSITQNSTTGVLYNITSDQRLKENIQDADSASALIDSLQVRKYDWKADGSHQRYGFIAQELVTVAPEAVHQPADPEQMMAVDYSKLVPMLVKEVQSLRARVAQLESK